MRARTARRNNSAKLMINAEFIDPSLLQNNTLVL
jgi:hypothetical protein